jgi:hypothetical protein
VEGPGNQRLVIDSAGQVDILVVTNAQGREPTLFLNFGYEEWAQQFLQVRRSQGHVDDVIKSFEVSEAFLQKLRQEAILESEVAHFGRRRSLRVDIELPDQFGLRSQQIEALRNAIIQGTGRQ